MSKKKSQGSLKHISNLMAMKKKYINWNCTAKEVFKGKFIILKPCIKKRNVYDKLSSFTLRKNSKLNSHKHQ